MKKLIMILIAAMLVFDCQAQGLEGIFVERYYETDAADAASASDNGSIVPLPPGSVVFRVFVDMAEGYKFSQLYGTDLHPIYINGSNDFYNDPSYGVAVNPATISANNIKKHTAMIDSWLGVGGVSNGKVGVLKNEDPDGSVGNLQGVLANNPGGCYGLPITGLGSQDGMMPNSPTTYVLPNSLGIGSSLEALDQTAGNSVTITNGAIAALGGVVGPTNGNRVLIGQFTLDGELSFSLNVQLINTATGAAENYVAQNPQTGELTHPTLMYNSSLSPFVSITYPTDNSTIGYGLTNLSAFAEDPEGSIVDVQFFVNGISVGSDNSFPYSVDYNAVSGSFVLTAIATDTDCLIASSQEVNVTVSSSQAPVVTLDAPTTAVEGSLISISASASDQDGSITQVEFFVNDISIGLDNSAPYSVNWVAVIGIMQEVVAVATDNSGLSTSSSIVYLNVNENIPPVISITSPLSTGDYVAPEVLSLSADVSDVDGTVVEVQFYVDGLYVGSDYFSPFTVTWISQSGLHAISAIAIDNNGGQTTALAVNIDVLDPTTEPYAVQSITQSCDVPSYCVPITASAAFPVSGVIAYELEVNYDPTYLTPSGLIAVSNDLIDAEYVDVIFNNASSGTLSLTLGLSQDAPVGSQFQGYGELVCIGFDRTIAFPASDSSLISVSSLIESYASETISVDVNSAYVYSVPNTFFTGLVEHGVIAGPLVSNESDAIVAPVTNIFGVLNGNITNADSPVTCDANGFFNHDLTNGLAIEISRDVSNVASVQKTINGADVQLIYDFLNGLIVPTIYQILAMDVNLDGAVTIDDITSIMQRTSLEVGEFNQAWNVNGEPAKDWIFFDQQVLNDPEFMISQTFPLDDGVGYSASRVPSVAASMQTAASDFNPANTNCQSWANGNYKSVLLGDVNSSYGIESVNSLDSTIIDLSQAVYSNDGFNNYIEIPVYALLEGDVLDSWDVALKFNTSKLSFSALTSIQQDFVATAHYNSSDEFLRITSAREQDGSISQNTHLLNLKFLILDDCASIFSSDFHDLINWLNGEVAGWKFIEGATLPDPVQVLTSGPYCVGSPVQFSYSEIIDGSAIDSYSWVFGDGQNASGQNVEVALTTPGPVPVTLNLTTVEGCSYTVGTELVVYSSPMVSFTYAFNADLLEVTFTNNSTIGGGSITSYSWDFGDNTQSQEEEPIHLYPDQGLYTATLTATSGQGCESSFSLDLNLTIGVEDVILDQSFVYPNPVSDILNIVYYGSESILVMDASGRIVYENSSVGAQGRLSLDVAMWPAGLYYVQCLGGNSFKSVRFIKVN